MIPLIDRYRGALVGLAVGDALGTTLEFARPGTFTPIDDMVGGGPFNLQPGEWTDDTSMALCLATSLVATGEFNTFDQMERYYRWYREGYLSSRSGICVDIGITTAEALHRFAESGQPISGLPGRMTAGNGSLMRLAPVPMFYREHESEAIKKSAISSQTTHAAPQAVDSCRYFSYLLLLAFRGESKDVICADYSYSEQWKSEPIDHEVVEVVQGSFKTRRPPEILASGYVVKTLEAALWAFYHTDSFAEGALMAVNLGNDADTVGAVYGQIAGAYYDVNAIPPEWLSKLYGREMIEGLANQLYAMSREV